MSRQRRILLNVGFSGVQVLVVSGVMLVLYRFLYVQLGPAVAGVWALVLSWNSVTSVASLGLAGSTARYVALYCARADEEAARRAVDTTVLTVGVLLLIVLPLLYPLFYQGLALIYEPGEEAALLESARSILPYALGSFWLLAVGMAVLSAIDGLERVSVRNGLMMGASVLYLALTLLWVPERGLIGLAQAQLVQAGVLLVAAWITLRLLFPRVGWFPLRWSWASLREMIGYGTGIQIISTTQLLFEPVTKSLLASINPGAVFFFDMAHKLAVQSRSVIATAHSGLVPTLTALEEEAPDRLRDVYRVSCRFMLLIVVVALPLLVGLIPYISVVWLGAYEPTFVRFAAVLAFAWFLNLIANAAYYDNWGTGRLGGNIAGHVVTAAVNVALGWTLGRVWGADGVVLAFAVALLAGNAVTLFAYQRREHVSTRSWLEWSSLGLFVGGSLLAAATWTAWFRLPAVEGWWLFALAPLWIALLSVPLWHHPLVREARTWLRPSARLTPEQP